jgi:hypothetical protein
MLMAFAARGHTDTFGRIRQVGYQSIAAALCNVAQSFVLANHGDPRSGRIYSTELGLAFTRLYNSYHNGNPTPRPQLELPISVLNDIMQHEGASLDPKDCASITDLVILAFFFLL